MRIKERLAHIEKKIHCDLIAFFSLSDKFSEEKQIQFKRDLWDEYLKNGGDPQAYPAYIAGLTGEGKPMFLGVEKRTDVLERIQKAVKRRMESIKS